MSGSTETIAACRRALARCASDARRDGAPVAEMSVSEVSVPEPPGPAVKATIAHRGAADATAFRQRFHDPLIHRRLAPAESVVGRWFDAFEQVRVEALGGRRFAGAASNMNAFWRERSAGAVAGQDELVFNALRKALMVAPGHADVSSDEPALQVIATARGLSHEESHRLAGLVGDQDAFGRQALGVITRLLKGLESGSEATAFAGGDAGGGDADESRNEGATSDSATDESAEGADAGGLEDDEDEEGVAEPALHDDPAAQAHASAASADQADGERRAADEAAWVVGDQGALETSAAGSYRVFTTRFDRTVAAAALAEAGELTELRKRLDGYIDRQGQLVQRLANRLYRRLLASQRRAWQFDEPEGELDASRLSRLITDPLQPLVFRREQEGPFRDTAVTLLLDNSRSMLGRPILVAAACADILARTLERCGVAVEVLGFTTASLHGGDAARQWEQQGRSIAPGRISDLRHIVYKAASQPWRRARAGFGLMLKPELLNQNVDGEALQWAHGRLMRRPASRRLLLVISDGAPVDVTTLAANDEQYLAAHLHQVIGAIEARNDVELLAIGIGHDVRSWYRRAVRIADPRDLGNVLISELTELFDE